jgi:hypothetical protein
MPSRPSPGRRDRPLPARHGRDNRGIEPQLAPDQVRRLDAVGAFVDRRDPRVAQMLGRAGLLDIAHAAMDLDAEAGDLAADVGAPGLGQRRQHFGAHRRGGIARARGRPGRRHNRPARARHGQRPHPQQHPPHVGMLGDRHRQPVALALLALDRIGDRALGRPLGDPDALQADVEPRIVHHREHRRMPPFSGPISQPVAPPWSP